MQSVDGVLSKRLVSRESEGASPCASPSFPETSTRVGSLVVRSWVALSRVSFKPEVSRVARKLDST